MAKFSVIVTTYNSEQYIVNCIESVLDQDFLAVEIVLVDDCSRDHTYPISQTLQKKYRNIRLVRHRNNLGVSSARNSGIHSAWGDYVIFLDADDYLLDGSLSAIAQTIDNNPRVNTVVTRYISERYAGRNEESPVDFWSNNSNPDVDNPDGIIGRIVDFRLLAPYCWRYAINRQFIMENELYFSAHIDVFEDREYISRLLCKTKTFAFCDQPTYLYRPTRLGLTFGATQSRKDKNSTAATACLRVVFGLADFLGENNFKKLKREFLNFSIRAYFTQFIAHLVFLQPSAITLFDDLFDRHLDTLIIVNKAFDDTICHLETRECGSRSRLSQLVDTCVSNTMAQMPPSDGAKIYIFCADLYGKATAEILIQNGYSVLGFLDNNHEIEGQLIAELKIYSPDIFSGKVKDSMTNVFVIVCHQRVEAYLNIANQLRQYGLEDHQIRHGKFGIESQDYN